MFFGPGIGVEQIMVRGINSRLAQESPEIHQVSSHSDEVFRDITRPINLARQSVDRLIYADNEMIWILQCESPCRQTNAAAGINDEFGLIGIIPGGYGDIESDATAIGERLLIISSSSPLKQVMQLIVNARLITGY